MNHTGTCILGIDFTSTPKRRKPITCAVGRMDGGVLVVDGLEAWTDFDGFEAFLARRGPWWAGIDFPFGQSRKLLENLGISGSWRESVEFLCRGTRKDFEAILTAYRAPREEGDKQHLRRTDERAKSCSPMMLYGVPVAKMFYEGAPRLLRSGVSVLPVRPLPEEERVVVEAYPKLVAARYADGQPYKREARRERTEAHRMTRRKILAGLQDRAGADFGFPIDLPPAISCAAVEDGSGDTLDAVLCAVQAAWSLLTTNPPNGIPAEADPLEGWIVDPGLHS